MPPPQVLGQSHSQTPGAHSQASAQHVTTRPWGRHGPGQRGLSVGPDPQPACRDAQPCYPL